MTFSKMGPDGGANRRARSGLGAFAIAILIGSSSPAAANNYGESLGWQFKTSADRANQAAVLDLIEKRRGGYYAAPIYNTNIARQYNCSINATATGNSGAQTALANSPTVAGATSTATGNDNTTTVGNGRSGGTVDGDQRNSGSVSSGVTGGTSANVRGVASQALNSEQTNSGNQSADVRGSNACAFGALN
ncbi:MAG: hypothetical protein JWR80_573 [Bradyrhizobium sp.]|nr:hypothetical protein [Bradyrhizobium sp.]